MAGPPSKPAPRTPSKGAISRWSPMIGPCSHMCSSAPPRRACQLRGCLPNMPMTPAMSWRRPGRGAPVLMPLLALLLPLGSLGARSPGGDGGDTELMPEMMAAEHVGGENRASPGGGGGDTELMHEMMAAEQEGGGANATGRGPPRARGPPEGAPGASPVQAQPLAWQVLAAGAFALAVCRLGWLLQADWYPSDGLAALKPPKLGLGGAVAEPSWPEGFYLASLAGPAACARVTACVGNDRKGCVHYAGCSGCLVLLVGVAFLAALLVWVFAADAVRPDGVLARRPGASEAVQAALSVSDGRGRPEHEATGPSAGKRLA
ncbi:unnamed protein product [Prorocentrum cordatum]|uniref:Uncharacterized protein n=1 Tax=Prorocentrum cordatum TaxID=2364126 RepID=A0ABN9WDS8_9DINO|nr:unnamed protein product [Polarella glacialis]